MEDLIKRIEFRYFSFETDPEFVVDMHRCLEVLEGSWFDQEETFRMHQKMVTRACGSSWIAVIGRAVVGYADLLEATPGNGCVFSWRLHPDFRHPKIVKFMIEGLKEQAKKRGWSSLTILAGTADTLQDLEKIGLAKDRQYQWINLSEFDDPGLIEPEALQKTISEMLEEKFIPYLGTPLPPGFVLARAFMASDYGRFNYRKPRLFSLFLNGIMYTACFDGREWFVFRKGKDPADADHIKTVLGTLAGLHEGRILVSKGAIEKAELVAASEESVWDVFLGGI